MSLSGDSCSTSSGCVSDLDNLSEDPSPDSPISDLISDSLHSSANSLVKSLPNNEGFTHEFAKELVIADTNILSNNTKVNEVVVQQIHELIEEELIQSEIVIDSSPVDCVDSLSLNQILTANCCALEYDSKGYEDHEDEGLVRDASPSDCYQNDFKTSFDFPSSLINCSKAETASIKSDTSSNTSGHESDTTTNSSGHNTPSGKQTVSSRPTLKGVFKDLNDFKCFSNTRKSDDLRSNSSKASTSSSSDTNGSAGGSTVHYCCKWTNCDWPGAKDDLVDHIREIHVELQPYQQQRHNWTEVHSRARDRSRKPAPDRKYAKLQDSPKKMESTQQYVCLWEGCKVYGKGSSSRNWLERHVLEQHSGPRPFKCIVEGCGQRFKVQSALERHVNSHFKPSMDCSNSNCSTDVTNMCSGSNSCCANACSNSDINLCPNSVHGLSPFELHLRQSSSCRATMSAVRCKTSAASSVDSSSTHSSSSSATATTASTPHHMCTNACNASTGTGGTPNKILKRKKSNQKVRRKCFIGLSSDCH